MRGRKEAGLPTFYGRTPIEIMGIPERYICKFYTFLQRLFLYVFHKSGKVTANIHLGKQLYYEKVV